MFSVIIVFDNRSGAKSKVKAHVYATRKIALPFAPFKGLSIDVSPLDERLDGMTFEIRSVSWYVDRSEFECLLTNDDDCSWDSDESVERTAQSFRSCGFDVKMFDW